MEGNIVGKKLSRKDQAIQTRRKLLDKALEAFTLTDMDEIRMKDLCASTGVSIGTFYYYYSTKEELLLEGYRFFDEEIVMKARSKSYESNLEALYSLISFRCGYHEGLFDKEKESLAFNIMQHYSEGELLLRKQVLRTLLINGGGYVIEPSRPMNLYVLELVEKAIASRELISDESANRIANSILRISLGTIFDWSVQNAPYCLHEQAVIDVKNYLSAFKSNVKNEYLF